MGVHTGESIVVAPAQTLTNQEYHYLREISIKLIRHLGVIGECNVQFALRTQNPKNLLPRKSNLTIEQSSNNINYRIIEVNARLSRSSALASKATGYPLAFIAAKLALGYSLPELKNSVTKKTSAFFEPALDYVVVKMPRWDLDKFKKAERNIGTQMKSVGEVMAIGRNLEQALQKASRMLGLDQNGLVASYQRLNQKYPGILPKLNQNVETRFIASQIKQSKNAINKDATNRDAINRVSTKLIHLIKTPNEHRLLAITEGLKQGLPAGKIAQWSKIDPWFIAKLKNITDLMAKLAQAKKLTRALILTAKNKGFSDKQIAVLMRRQADDIYKYRLKHKLMPKVNQIDTLAAEYPAKTNYLYLTYL